MPETPAALGFRLPAEWFAQDAVWLSWPLNPATWPGRRRALQADFARLAGAIARRLPVRINAAVGRHAAILRRLEEAGAPRDRIRLFDHPTQDAWCRDHGPTFLRHPGSGEIAVLDWPYNAWGGKFPPWDLDDRVPRRIARALGLRRFRAPIIGEGGGLEGNGAGDLLVTESVWLHPNRNPGLTRARAERVFRGFLGVERIHWLAGGLAGDDTDGHIDTLARFVREDAVVCAAPAGPRDPNRAVLEENRARLERLRVAGGARLQVIPLPQPGPVRPPAGWRAKTLPATYANFLVTNGAVLVPSYGQPGRDRRAARILRGCFPGREVEAIDSTVFLLEGGAIHCLSQQQPRGGILPPADRGARAPSR